MYDGLYAQDKDTPALYRAITSLILAGRRRDARELFESLSPALKETLHYADVGVAIYEQAGLLREARGFVETALAHDNFLSRRVRWLNLLERIGDEEAIIRWLDSLDPDQQGAPQDLMRVAITIDRLRGDPVCFRFAYRALRSGYSDPSMHLAYMMSLVFTGKSQKLAFTTPTEVAPDTAVLLAEKGGGRKLVRILETEPNPRIESNEIAPNAELGPALLGRKVGDEIEIPSISVGPTVYVISEIRNKYLHAHYRSLEQFEVLFPGHQRFGSFSIDESKGDAKFKPIFEFAKRRSEFIAAFGGHVPRRTIAADDAVEIFGPFALRCVGKGRRAIRSRAARLRRLPGVSRCLELACSQPESRDRSGDIVRTCPTRHRGQGQGML